MTVTNIARTERFFRRAAGLDRRSTICCCVAKPTTPVTSVFPDQSFGVFRSSFPEVLMQLRDQGRTLTDRGGNSLH